MILYATIMIFDTGRKKVRFSGGVRQYAALAREVRKGSNRGLKRVELKELHVSASDFALITFEEGA